MEKLGDLEVQKILKKWRIPVVRQVLAKTPKQALAAAKQLGLPVALKVSSPDVIHKSEAKALLLNLNSTKAVKAGFELILKRTKKYKPKAKIDGVLVQEMIAGPQVREVIIGAKYDGQFGPVLMFGLGGIFVEVLKDVTFRLIPISLKDAQAMVKEIKAYPVLAGTRGQKPINFKALTKYLIQISRLVQGEKRIRELDINPLFVDTKRALAGDVRILREDK